MDYNESVYEYMLCLNSVVFLVVDCVNFPSLFTFLVRMTMGAGVMAWGHAVSGNGTHHCSYDSINGCILVVLNMMHE